MSTAANIAQRVFARLSYQQRRSILRELTRVTIEDRVRSRTAQQRPYAQRIREDVANLIASDVVALAAAPRSEMGTAALMCAQDREAEPFEARPAPGAPRRRRRKVK